MITCCPTEDTEAPLGMLQAKGPISKHALDYDLVAVTATPVFR